MEGENELQAELPNHWEQILKNMPGHAGVDNSVSEW